MAQQHLKRYDDAPNSSQLAMRTQNFSVAFNDVNAQANTATDTATLLWRIIVIVCPALACLGFAIAVFAGRNYGNGVALSSLCLLCLALVPLYWEMVAAAQSAVALFWNPPPRSEATTPMRVALLVTLYDEAAGPVLSRAFGLLQQLDADRLHSFSLHVLSDSRRPANVDCEQALFNSLVQQHGSLDASYRRRIHNTNYKSGNIKDWITLHGGAHDAMLILDADSRMTPDGVLHLTQRLAADSGLALAQSLPEVLQGSNLWQAMQAHASRTAGPLLGRGLAMLSGGRGNYYGHNAIIRIAAFATCAGLPLLPGQRPFGGVITSHDFVEAALLCRAGWRVDITPEVTGSFEETPADIFGFIHRDRRWCSGNIQHLQVLFARGLPALSRFHLLQGAMQYLNAPLWFIACLAWSSGAVSLPPNLALPFLTTLIVALLLPRLLGWVFPVTASPQTLRSVIVELLLSSLIAPSLLIQRLRILCELVLGRDVKWLPQQKLTVSVATAVRFHLAEILVALLLLLLLALGILSGWILAVALPLMASPWLSARLFADKSFTFILKPSPTGER